MSIWYLEKQQAMIEAKKGISPNKNKKYKRTYLYGMLFTSVFDEIKNTIII